MAFETTSNRMPPYAGGSTALQFPFTFPLRANAKSDLRVLLEDEEGAASPLTLNVDYQVNINSNASTGGNVVLLDADQAWLDENGTLAAGYRLHLLRVVPVKQSTSIKNQGEFYPKTHEDAFDHMVMISQQLGEQLGRALKLPEQIIPSEFDPSLPAGMVGAAGRTFVTNEDGTGLMMGPTIGDLEATLVAAASALESAEAAETFANEADASADAAHVSEQNAALSADSAAQSAGAAADSELEAETARDDAADAAQDAAASAAAAATSAGEAAAAALPHFVGTRSSPVAVVEADGIAFDNAALSRDHIHFVVSSGGEHAITANPQVSNATGGASAIGKCITLIGRSSTNQLLIEDGRGLSLNGPCYLGLNSTLSLIWDGADWVELSRNGA